MYLKKEEVWCLYSDVVLTKISQMKELFLQRKCGIKSSRSQGFPSQRVTRSRRDQWLPSTRKPETHPTPWRGKCKTLPRQLSGLPNAITSWSGNQTSRMKDDRMISMTNRMVAIATMTVPQRVITRKGKIRKKETLLAGETSKRTLAVLPSWKPVQYT